MANPLPQALRQAALRCLAQREHSRSELQGRLLRSASRSARRRQPDALGPDAAAELPHDDAAAALPALRATVEAVLDQLEAQGLLSDKRFIETRVHARRAQWGSRRIAHELQQHGLALDNTLIEGLKHSELARALALWQRRFSDSPDEPKERLRQMRFLAARGFSGEVIRQVLRWPDSADDTAGTDADLA